MIELKTIYEKVAEKHNVDVAFVKLIFTDIGLFCKKSVMAHKHIDYFNKIRFPNFGFLSPVDNLYRKKENENKLKYNFLKKSKINYCDGQYSVKQNSITESTNQTD